MNKKIILGMAFAALVSSLVIADGLLTYKPAQLNAPQARLGGGTRGLIPPKIQVLAPQHTALTAKSQPVLYWYLAKSNQTVEIAIFEKGAAEPLLKKVLDEATNGLKSIRLADYSVSLQIGKEYEWSVTLSDENKAMASGFLIYQLPKTTLSSVEQQAEAGYWYDALEQLIESHSPLAKDLLKQIDATVPNL